MRFGGCVNVGGLTPFAKSHSTLPNSTLPYCSGIGTARNFARGKPRAHVGRYSLESRPSELSSRQKTVRLKAHVDTLALVGHRSQPGPLQVHVSRACRQPSCDNLNNLGVATACPSLNRALPDRQYAPARIYNHL